MAIKLQNSSTQVLAVLGDPIAHSLSPLMHNAAYKEFRWDSVYIPCRVKREQLSEAIQGLRALGFKGANLTIPHKEAALDLLDEISGEAQLSGSVNTIINRAGRLIGASTDGIGLLESLRVDGRFDPRDKRVLLLGAGGSAAAVVYALVNAGINSLTIINRTREKADRLAAKLAAATGFNSSVVSFQELEQIEWDSYDLLINTTSVGLTEETTPVPREYLQPAHFVYDLVYKPGGTRLYREAIAIGCQALSGLSLLLFQGAASFRLWFDQEPPLPVMRRALTEANRG